MGFESFRVELRGGPRSHAEVEEVIRGLPHARTDHESIGSCGSTYYTVNDAAHIIEVEVATSPLRVSCRFTLCHPESIDSVFLALVGELMSRLGMEARICDDVLPHHTQGFSIVKFSELSNVASRSISARRSEWVENFGPAQACATTSEAFERFILPRCVPVVG